MLTTSLTLLEKRAILSLSLIIALRMIALFMALPLFALYASSLQNATPLLIGFAIGIYGLSQALFQIPFGALSDRYGRKPVIAIGLLIFVIGSFVSASVSSIWGMIAGRALQGSGAVGSTLLALLSDCTRIEKRTQSMAIAGISIGGAFGIAILTGPILTQWFTVGGLFCLAGILGMITLILLYTVVPSPQNDTGATSMAINVSHLIRLFHQPDLWRLNSGIFILHAIFSASFVVIPFDLFKNLQLSTSHQWLLYVPSLSIAFPLSFICMGFAERTQKIKVYFISAISLLLASELLLLLHTPILTQAIITLTLFFLGFSLLEAFLPSLVSRTAPPAQKGSALGIYSCAQFLGIFAGGTMGGFLYGHFNTTGVYCFCIFLCLTWLSFAFSMKPPRRLITHLLELNAAKRAQWATILADLQTHQEILEVHYAKEQHTFYIKMHDTPLAAHCFLQLKETVES